MLESSIPVTRTKVVVPRRRDELLPRPRLLDVLSNLLDYKLTILAAPAGYGKTSLLVDFAEQTHVPMCWFSLDPLDRDPRRFIAHLIWAIHAQFPEFGHSAMAALNNATQEPFNTDMMVSIIVNDAYEHIGEHFALVLDDYHIVEDVKPIDAFVNHFLQDMDENCHLVIASRVLLTLPDLPLLVARSQVSGLSFEELAFRPEEIRELLLRNHSLTISEESAVELAKQTEGWITGLLLSAQAIGREIGERLKTPRVSGVGLYDYLAQQVLDQQPPEIQDFLLRTALFEEFDADLCREVVGEALGLDLNWPALMDWVVRHNLFVLPVEAEKVYLRYHHLFRNFLQTRMLRDRAGESGKIQLRLAQVYSQRGEWEQAYALFRSLGQTEAVAALLEQAGDALYLRGQLTTLTEWLGSLPVEQVGARPVLVALQGSVAVMRGEIQLGLDQFNHAIETLRRDGPGVLLASVLIKRSAAERMTGAYAAAGTDADEALALLAGRGDALETYADGCRAKGILHYQQGQPKDALEWLQRSLSAYQALGSKASAARLEMEIGMCHKALGSPQAAETAYTQALEFWQSTGNAVWQANVFNNLGVLYHTRGEYEQAAFALERAVQYARSGAYPRLEAYALASIGDLYRDLEAPQEALEAYQQAHAIAHRTQDRFLLIYLLLVEGVLAAGQGQRDAAEGKLRAAEQMARDGGSSFEQNLCLLESGHAALLQDRAAQALDCLEPAAAFFTAAGHRAEAARALLYLAMARFQNGSKQDACEPFEQALKLAGYPDSQPFLIAAGVDLRARLEEMRSCPSGQKVGGLLRQVARFEQRVPTLRRLLRRRVSAVPFAPPKIVIRALGRMQVRVNGRLVSSGQWQTQTGRDLFFFLLAHPEGLTKESVGAVFWPDSSPAELKLRFKNTMYRIRHALGKDVVSFQDEYYRFNRSLDYEYDVETFLKESAMADQAAEPPKKMAHLKAALKVYRGAYLPDMVVSWATAEREHLRQMCLDMQVRLATLQLEGGQHQAALETCQQTLEEDPTLEAAHRLAMRAHAAMGNRVALVRQYEQCAQILREEINATPSQQTRALYEALMR